MPAHVTCAMILLLGFSLTACSSSGPEAANGDGGVDAGVDAGGDGGTDGGMDGGVAKTCDEKAWSTPADRTDNLSPDGSDAVIPEVAVDGQGNAVAVWQQDDGSTDCLAGSACPQIYRAEFRDGQWTTPNGLADHVSQGDSLAFRPKVAADSAGNVIVTWYQTTVSETQVFKSEYRDTGSGFEWADPLSLSDFISPGPTAAAVPVVAMNDADEAIIAWTQRDSSSDCNSLSCRRIMFSERRDFGSGVIWKDPASLGDVISPPGSDATFIDVAMDDAGNTIIVWRQTDESTDCFGGPCFQIFMSEYRDFGSGFEWRHPVSRSDFFSRPGFEAFDPQVAMDDGGQAIVVWIQSVDGGPSQVYRREYRNGAWSPVPDAQDFLGTPSSFANSPQVAMDDAGNAILTWPDSSSGSYGIFLSEYRDFGSGFEWQHPTDSDDIISPPGTFASAVVNAMSSGGAAMIAWDQQDANGDRQVLRSTFCGESWAHPTDLGDAISFVGDDATSVVVATGDSGDAVLLWQQSDGNDQQIFGSTFR